MENWFKRVLLAGGISLSVVSPVWAADSEVSGDEPIIKPEVEPRSVEEDLIDTENFEIGAYGGIYSIEDFGTDVVVGVKVAYHMSEDLFLEVNYGMTEAGETSFETLSGNVRLLPDDDRDLTYYSVDIGYNFLPGEAFFGRSYAFNTNFYVLAGLGSTDFAGDDRLTANFGWGYQFLPTDWLSVRLDLRDHIFDNDILGADKTTHNLEFTSGLTIFF
ncbi:outer membrane beta-barrel domain-containing protein [Hahella sp. CCB-MM4]|uniref:outer membrane beta-barrel domain-containing protein n=1 Tax=Hahella sp. (strain CCB-MM4) TaxID=1926491 RepID=UPI000B9AD6A6|nr:outer membrane beta-barrel domain-containing protein [Hahella sp. CCB-MM4]OZG73536.1 outer membrane beta-barrel domain-containing protein [Hahella sp. CCB-MM4]